MSTNDPYAVVECRNRRCGHFMMARTYRNISFPGTETPKENIHLIGDGTLSAPLVYGCTCGHFTIIGKAEHLTRWEINQSYDSYRG
jgi:hypothetical protein